MRSAECVDFTGCIFLNVLPKFLGFAQKGRKTCSTFAMRAFMVDFESGAKINRQIFEKCGNLYCSNLESQIRWNEVTFITIISLINNKSFHFRQKWKEIGYNKKWSKKSAPPLKYIFTLTLFHLIIFFLLFFFLLQFPLHFIFFLFSPSNFIFFSLKKFKNACADEATLHINHKRTKQRPKKFCFLFFKNIKRNVIWEPVKPTYSADRTTGELWTSMACIILLKYLKDFPTGGFSVRCRVWNRVTSNIFWIVSIYSDLWVKRFVNIFRWILLKSSKIEHIPLLDTFKFWAGEELLVSKRTLNT